MDVEEQYAQLCAGFNMDKVTSDEAWKLTPEIHPKRCHFIDIFQIIKLLLTLLQDNQPDTGWGSPCMWRAASEASSPWAASRPWRATACPSPGFSAPVYSPLFSSLTKTGEKIAVLDVLVRFKIIHADSKQSGKNTIYSTE